MRAAGVEDMRCLATRTVTGRIRPRERELGKAIYKRCDANI
jgi:hypothetical protein